jgi:hypothetical protein
VVQNEDIHSRPTIQLTSTNTISSHSSLKSSTTVNLGQIKTKETASISRKDIILKVGEPIPDIERPAGRTWKEQLEYDLKDEDDVASTSSLDDILLDVLDSRTMWDDYKESLLKHQKEEDERCERFLQEKIDKLLEQDRQEEKGLECLLDVVAMFGEPSLDVAEDDWSLPASSLCNDYDPLADDSILDL